MSNQHEQVTVSMLPVGRRKAESIGEPMGVIVRNDAGALAAVTDLGRVTWLDDCVAGPVGGSAQGAEPVAYRYRFTDPISGSSIWRFDSAPWNGQKPREAQALYTHLQPAQQGGVPDGWKLVPILATDEMADALDPSRKNSMQYLRNGWMMACAAAPQPPRGQEGSGDE